jgi:hypothetical protein
MSSGVFDRIVKCWSLYVIPILTSSAYRRVMVYVLNVGTHSSSFTRWKLLVNDLVWLNGIILFMSVLAIQVTCLDTTSSGSVKECPHIVVEYVDMVTESESMVQERSAWLAGSRVFRRLRERGMCWPGATLEGRCRVGTMRGVEVMETATPEKTFRTRESSLSLAGFQT